MDVNGSSLLKSKLPQIKVQLDRLREEREQYDRYLVHTKAIGIITELLSLVNIRPIIVGGFAVELYTAGSYSTMDIDLVLSGYQEAGHLLEQVGFIKHTGRHWYDDKLDMAIEVPGSVLAGSLDKITEIELDNRQSIYMIGVEDLVLDRLRAFAYWGSTSDGEWAERLVQASKNDVDFDYMAEIVKKESPDLLEKFNALLLKHKPSKS
jgi:hypothetical protein